MSIYPSLTESISVEGVFYVEQSGYGTAWEVAELKNSNLPDSARKKCWPQFDRTSSTRDGTVREVTEL